LETYKTGKMMKEPALGMIELKSVARGVNTLDVIAKKAPVSILKATPVSSGKFIILFTGDVASVEESILAGVESGQKDIINHLFLPYVHDDIIPAITQSKKIDDYQSIGIIETYSICACIGAADLAVKETPVSIIEIKLGNSIGGKGYFILSGNLSDLEASMEVATNYLNDKIISEPIIIPSPHPDLIENGIYWQREGLR